jgi:hypothetical protein
MLVLLVLLMAWGGILRSSMSAPQLSQRSGFTSLGERQEHRANTNSYRIGVTCSPGKGCVGPESATAQYVAYGKTTVHPYLCILYLSPVLGTFNSTSSFTPKGLLCMGRTLFPSMASIALPWMNKIETVSKQLHFYFVSKQRGGEKWHEVKSSKNPRVQSILMACLHWGKWKVLNTTTDLCVC